MNKLTTPILLIHSTHKDFFLQARLFAGESFRSLSYHFRINNTTIGQIISEVCQALYNRLQPEYLKILFNSCV